MDTIQQNWPAVKQAFAKAHLGLESGGSMTDTDLHQKINDRLQADDLNTLTPGKWSDVARYKLHQFSKEAGDFWEGINKPFVELPTAPQLPDLPGMGAQNPAIVAGVYNSVIKPLVEGVETPLGVGSLGVAGGLKVLGETYPAARYALAGMTSVFTGLMAKATVDSASELPAVLKDPNATTQQRIEAFGKPVGTAAMTVLGALGTVMELKTPEEGMAMANKLKGKDPAEGAQILREEATRTPDPDLEIALHNAADHLESIAEPKKIETTKTAPEPTPLPDAANVTVMEMGEKRAVQIDVPGEGDRPAFSGSPEDAARAGYTVPDLENVPEGKHTVADIAKAQEPPKGTAEIQQLENGGYVVTAGGKLVDYTETAEQAHEVASRHNLAQAEQSQGSASGAGNASNPGSGAEAKPAPAAAPPADELGTTGIKNAKVDAELATMDMPPATHGEKLSFEQAMDSARTTLTRDSRAGEKLVTELEGSPRPVTGEEDALLLNEANRLKLDRNNAQDAFDKAKASGDQEAINQARLSVESATAAYGRAADVFTQVGTKNAIGLALRRMMIKEDYSLAAVERRQTIANEGAPLSEKSAAENVELVKRLKEVEDNFTKRMAEKDTQLANAAMDKALLDLYRDAAKKSTKVTAPKTVEKFLADRAAAAMERIKGRAINLNAGIDPTVLGDLVDIGAHHLYQLAKAGVVKAAEWKDVMVKQFGDAIKPHLDDLFSRAKEASDNAPKLAGAAKEGPKIKATTLEKMKEKMDGGRKMDDMSYYIRKLARQYVEEGVTDREKLIDAVHKDVSTIAPDFTRRQTMDSISGYGDFAPLSKDTVSVTLRDLKGQMQQLGKLEDMKAGEAPAKTGPERRAPSNIERELIKQVEAEKRKGGYTVTDPATQLKTALQSTETRLTNSIADIERQLRTNELFEPNKATPATNAAIDAKRAQLEALRQQRDYARELIQAKNPEPPTAIEDRVSRLDAQIQYIEKQLRTGEVFSKETKKPAVESPEIKVREEALAALKEQRDYMRESLQPKTEPPTPEELRARAIESVKKRLQTRIEDMQERLKNEDFGPRQSRTPLALDREADTLKTEAARIKTRLREKELEYQDTHRPGWVKKMDFTGKWVRGAVLSSPVTFVKLVMATVTQAGFHPLDEMAASINSKAFSRLADRAPIEGSGFNFEQSAKAAASGIMDGWKDMRDTLSKKQGHKSDIDVRYGKAGLPQQAIEFFGVMHGAEKAFLKRGFFTYAMEKQAAYNLAHGIDMTDPGVQMRMGMEAYKYANRKIFQEDNIVSTATNRALSAFKEKDKTTGRESVPHMMAYTGARILMPVAKVGTNIMLQSFERALGTVYAAGKMGGATYRGFEKGDSLAMAYAKGIDKLKPEEADIILRNLKEGEVGLALLATGYLLPHIFGGYFHAGQKRKPGDIKEGEISSPVEIPKTVSQTGDVPSYMLHSPALEQFQLGSDLRRMSDSKLRKSDKEAAGITNGMMAAGLGLVKQIPVVSEAWDATRAMEFGRQGNFIGGMLSKFNPQAVQWVARKMDTDSRGDKIKRTPNGVIQSIEAGIPGLRENVPVSRKR